MATLAELEREQREAAERLVDGIDGPRRDLALALAAEVMWQKGKLEKARKQIGAQGVAIKYDNGGGQKGIRRNPAFDGYNSLFKSFTAGIARLEEMIGDQGGDASAAASALQSLRLELGPMRPRSDG